MVYYVEIAAENAFCADSLSAGFPKSADAEELDDFLSNQFIPTNKQSPGLRSLKISVGDLMSPGGPPPYAKIIEASFDSLNDVMAVVQSPATQAMRDQMKALGVFILMYEVSEL